jgi:hypothetical protein
MLTMAPAAPAHDAGGLSAGSRLISRRLCARFFAFALMAGRLHWIIRVAHLRCEGFSPSGNPAKSFSSP